MSGSSISSVSQLKILGCIFSCDLRWNVFVDYLVKASSRRIYFILSLKRAKCNPQILFTVYSTLIRSILLYAYPAVCNMPAYLRSRLEKVERRVFRIIDSDIPFPSLFSVGDKICYKMFSKVLSDCQHPLRVFFSENNYRDVRNYCPLRKPRMRTQRFSNSFLRYCK
jgi:hypothetical protein